MKTAQAYITEYGYECISCHISNYVTANDVKDFYEDNLIKCEYCDKEQYISTVIV